MAGGVTGGTIGQAARRRRALAGKSGWGGLMHNRRVFAITVFASLGGLLYGYNQGVFSGVLACVTDRPRYPYRIPLTMISKNVHI